jgi:apolipoprotein N-acyltransferase
VTAIDFIRRRGQGLLSFAMGAAAALAMPPTNMWWIFFITIPALVWRLEQIKGIRQGLWQGWLFGFGYFCVALHWIGFAFLVDAATFLWMMPFAVGGLAAVMALYWSVASGVVVTLHKVAMPPWLTFPVLLSVAEWLRGHLMTGFPWDAPGLAFDGMGDFIQLAALTGMPGLTLILLLWAASLRALFAHVSIQQKWAAVVLLFCAVPAWFWSHDRAGRQTENEPGIQLLIVQPNIPQDDKSRSENASRIFDDLVAQSAASPSATHIIWPESAVPFLLDESKPARSVLHGLLKPDRTLITGAIRRATPNIDAPYFTSIQVYDKSAELISVYDKWRLVPGGEYLPFAGILEPLGFKRLVSLPDGFSAGPGPRTLTIPGAGAAAALICYEAIFPDRLVEPGNRPQWIVNVTNDGWFGNSTGPYQHFALVRMRAVEQGLPAVRSANTGISGVIDPYGQVIAATRLGTRATLLLPLPKNLPSTPYGKWGDLIFAVFLLVLSIIAITFAQRLR